MAPIPLSRPRRRATGAAPAEKWRLDGASNAFVSLASLSRIQIQARGRGAIAVFNPGQFDGDPRRRAIQEIDAKVAKKMYANKKSALRIISIQDGRRVTKLAEELDKKGVSDPYFRALTRLFPQFSGKSEWDRAHEKRRAIAAKNVHKQKYGEYPDESMTIEQVERKNAGFAIGMESVMEQAADFDPFAKAEEIDIDDLVAEVEADMASDPSPAPEADEDVGDEPESPAAVAQRVLATDEAEIAQLKALFASQFGIKSFKGQPSLSTLRAQYKKLSERKALAG